MLHNLFTEGQKATGCGTAPMNKTLNTSVNRRPRIMTTPEDRIRQIKQRMANPPTIRKAIEIESPEDDPTVRKKTRYEHSLCRIVKTNPKVKSTIEKILTKPPTDLSKCDSVVTNPTDHVDNNQISNTNISDSASDISSNPSIEIHDDIDLDTENQQLIAELTVSDSEDDTEIIPPSISNQEDSISTHSSTDSDIKNDKGQSEIGLSNTNLHKPYEVETVNPIPTYVPTPKSSNREDKGKRAVRFIPVSEWMFDQWRIICKANQAVGDAMKDAMIKEGLLHARK